MGVSNSVERYVIVDHAQIINRLYSMLNRGLHVGVTIDKYKGIQPSVLLKGIKILGINFIEIGMSVLDDAEAVSSQVKRIRTGFHLPIVDNHGWDFSCTDYRDRIDDAIEKINSHREMLNIQHVICHPPEPKATNGVLKVSANTLMRNLSRLQLPVYIENVPSESFDDFIDFYENAKKNLGDQMAGVCFDAPHSYVSNQDPIETFNKLNGFTRCIHLSDCTRGDDLHMPFNMGGSFPIQELLKAMKIHKFRGYVTLEIKPGSFDDIDHYLDSYLLILRALRFFKFVRAKFRFWLFRSNIKHFISEAKSVS